MESGHQVVLNSEEFFLPLPSDLRSEVLPPFRLRLLGESVLSVELFG